MPNLVGLVREDTHTECFSIALEQGDCPSWSYVLAAGNTKPAVIKLKVFCSDYAPIWLRIDVAQNAWTFYISGLAGSSLSRHRVFHGAWGVAQGVGAFI